MISEASISAPFTIKKRRLDVDQFIELGGQKDRTVVLHTIFLTRSPPTGKLTLTEHTRFGGQCEVYLVYDHQILVGCLFMSNKKKTSITPYRMVIGHCPKDETMLRFNFILENLGILVFESTTAVLLTSTKVNAGFSDLIIDAEI